MLKKEATEAVRPIEVVAEENLARWPAIGVLLRATEPSPQGEMRSWPLVTDMGQIADFQAAVLADAGLQEVERALCRKCFVWFASHWLVIINKKGERQTLTLNEPQWMYRNGQGQADIILKARKEGMSTYTLAEFFWRALFGRYTNTVVMAHQRDSAQELFGKVDIFDKSLPPFLKPHARRDSTRELYYDLGPTGETVEARYLVASAGSKEWGRGGDVDQVLLSELAFYKHPERTIAAVVEAARDNAVIRVESTANGRNWMYDEWKRAKGGLSRFKPFFLPWYADPTNTTPLVEGEALDLAEDESNMVNAHGLTPGQIKWRRQKRIDLPTKFGQEYPENDEDPFTVKVGRVYPTFEPTIHQVYPDPDTGKYPPIGKDWKRYRAVDFGWTNPFVCLWIAVNKDAEVFVYHEWYKREMRTEEHVPIINARSRGKKFQWTVCDHDADGRADLNAGGIPTVNALKKYSLEFGFDLLRKLLVVKPNGRSSLFVYSDCEGLIGEFLNYAYPEAKGDTQSEKPKQEWDHALDALRYFVVRWARETGYYWPMAA